MCLIVNALVGFQAPEKAEYGTDDQKQENVQGKNQQERAQAKIRHEAGQNDPENDHYRND